MRGPALLRRVVFPVLVFLAIWIIFTESLSPGMVLIGVAVSVGCAHFSERLLPMKVTAGVSFFKVGAYLFYLIGCIYMAGFNAIKLIVQGAKVDIVAIKTDIGNDFLKVMLANSITLTPGTITLDLEGEDITVLWLREKSSGAEDLENAGAIIKGGMEARLSSAAKGKG